MTKELAKLAQEGDIETLKTWMEEQKEPAKTHDILWCAMWTEHPEVRQFLIETAMADPIVPEKKGWQWNDALAAAVLGDPTKIAIAEERGADFENTAVVGTPLTTAIRMGHVEFVRALLEKGVDTAEPVKMARLGKMNIFGQNVMMTSATPLGVALRMGSQNMTETLMAFAKPESFHLADAVQGANQNLIKTVLEQTDKSTLEPALFWSVYDPTVLPLLEQHGLDLSKLPTDTGTWGGPIWSWWAYHLRGEFNEVDAHVNRFAALFETGVRATTAGLAEVLCANSQKIQSTAMVDLFVEHGADLNDVVQWEVDGWDNENDCQAAAKGSIVDLMMNDGDFEMITHLHSLGAPVSPTRIGPYAQDGEKKSAWLEKHGLVKELTFGDFPWLDSPSAEEVQKFLATDDGLFGLKFGMSRDELKPWDVDRAEGGDLFQLEFEDEMLVGIVREYQDGSSEVSDAIVASLTAKFGKPKKRGRERKWVVGDATISYSEESNDYFSSFRVEMWRD